MLHDAFVRGGKQRLHGIDDCYFITLVGVSRVWKGEVAEQAILMTTDDSCGVSVFDTRIVYARQHRGTFLIGACTRSLEPEKAELEFLGQPRKTYRSASDWRTSDTLLGGATPPRTEPQVVHGESLNLDAVPSANSSPERFGHRFFNDGRSTAKLSHGRLRVLKAWYKALQPGLVNAVDFSARLMLLERNPTLSPALLRELDRLIIAFMRYVSLHW